MCPLCLPMRVGGSPYTYQSCLSVSRLVDEDLNSSRFCRSRSPDSVASLSPHPEATWAGTTPFGYDQFCAFVRPYWQPRSARLATSISTPPSRDQDPILSQAPPGYLVPTLPCPGGVLQKGFKSSSPPLLQQVIISGCHLPVS